FTSAGSVTFTVTRPHASRDASNASTARMTFAVADTGVGIAPADLDQIFQPFEQVGDASARAEGTGLGLPISRKIVELMGGTIHVRSQLGVGSTFSFEIELPVADNWTERMAIADGHQIVGYEGDRQHLLVVDDRWENRAVLRELLHPLGFQIAEAENGREALEAIARQSFDLVITDLSMPVMDGLDLLAHLRRDPNARNLPVIVSSASVSNQDRQVSLDAGGDDFLPKPIHANDLFAMLADRLAIQWRYEQTEDSPAKNADAEPDAIAFPPAEELRDMLDLARSGLLFKLVDRAEQIGAESDRYTPFSRAIAQLAKDFQTEAIEAMLLDHLDTPI
ncbi:MAG: response regulator, partial [Cyanobacteria bacterium J06639_1]